MVSQVLKAPMATVLDSCWDGSEMGRNVPFLQNLSQPARSPIPAPGT